MNKLFEFRCDLKELNDFSLSISKKLNAGDVVLLNGDLGVGKTTFARLIINSLFDRYNFLRPKKISSPTFPILITYSLKQYEISHFDLYRLNNKKELFELGFFEEIKRNISFVEWPDIILQNNLLSNYYLINLVFIDTNNRIISIHHTHKTKL